MVPEAMAAAMPCRCREQSCCRRREVTCKLIFFSLFLCIFHQIFINNRQNPWGKKLPTSRLLQILQETERGEREGRLNLVTFIFNEVYFNLF